MNSELWKQIAKWEIKAIAILWVINVIVVVGLSLGIEGFQFISSTLLSKLTFVETGVALLVGGIVAFSGSVSASKSKEFILKSEQNWSVDKLRAQEKQANKYLLLAALFFLQSITISLVGF
jgi:hypothetical protein